MAASIVQGVVDRYLQKWVKNATTEHAGLWEGELVFKNVELRLDVMQQELGLPVVFTRGFIQELRVYLPLANILRENIRITLSNVEVVARTPNTESEGEVKQPEEKPAAQGPDADQNESGSKAKNSSGAQRAGEEKPKGWVASTLSKITENVRVELRNVVFKYCSNKYVSSLSWKTLSFYPCSPSWQPRFAEPVGPTRARYKVLSIEHATWCLDPADKDGVVSSYVSPFFNRESVEVRIISRGRPDGDGSGNSPLLQLPAQQVDVRFNAFELTVSDRQLAMLHALSEELRGMVRLIRDRAPAKASRPLLHRRHGSQRPDGAAASSSSVAAAASDSDQPESDHSSTPAATPVQAPLRPPSSASGAAPAPAVRVAQVLSVTVLEFVLIARADTAPPDTPHPHPPPLPLPHAHLPRGAPHTAPAAAPLQSEEMLRLTATGITLLHRALTLTELPPPAVDPGPLPSTPLSAVSAASASTQHGSPPSDACAQRSLKDVRLAVATLHVAYDEDGRLRTLLRFGGSLALLNQKPPLPSRDEQRGSVSHEVSGRGGNSSTGSAKSSSKSVKGGRVRGGLVGREGELQHGVANLFSRRGGGGGGGLDSSESEYEVDEDEEVVRSYESRETAERLHALLASPLSREVDAGREREGGDLLQQLMGSAGGQLAELLLRKAQGEAVEVEVSRPADGWRVDDSASLLVAFSELSAARGHEERGAAAAASGNAARGVGSDGEERQAEGAEGQQWVKVHVQPMNALVTDRARRALQTMAGAFRPREAKGEEGAAGDTGRIKVFREGEGSERSRQRAAPEGSERRREGNGDEGEGKVEKEEEETGASQGGAQGGVPARVQLDLKVGAMNVVVCGAEAEDGVSRCCVFSLKSLSWHKRSEDVSLVPAHRPGEATAPGGVNDLDAAGEKAAAQARYDGKLEGVQVRLGFRHSGTGGLGGTRATVAVSMAGRAGAASAGAGLEGLRCLLEREAGVVVEGRVCGEGADAGWRLRGKVSEVGVRVTEEDITHVLIVANGAGERRGGGEAAAEGGELGWLRKGSVDRSLQGGRGGAGDWRLKEGAEEGGQSGRATTVRIEGVEIMCGLEKEGEAAVRVGRVSWDSEWLEAGSGEVGSGAEEAAALVLRCRFFARPTGAAGVAGCVPRGLLEAMRHRVSVQMEGTGLSLAAFPLRLLPLLRHLRAHGALHRRSPSVPPSQLSLRVGEGLGRVGSGSARHSPPSTPGAVSPGDAGIGFSSSWGQLTAALDKTRDSTRVQEALASAQRLRAENRELEDLLRHAAHRAGSGASDRRDGRDHGGTPRLSVRSSSSVVADVTGKPDRKKGARGRAAQDELAAASRCCDCKRRVRGRDVCERLLEEAQGLRRAVHALARGVSSASSKVRSALSKPWPVVVALFTYAAVLHIVIAMLLHSMAGLHDHAAVQQSAGPELAMAMRQSSLMMAHGKGLDGADVSDAQPSLLGRFRKRRQRSRPPSLLAGR